MTMRSETKLLAIICSGSGAASTVLSAQCLQARLHPSDKDPPPGPPPLLTPRKVYKIFRRLHIELLALVISDYGSFCAARAANALLRAARNDALDARQRSGQLLTARMLLFIVCLRALDFFNRLAPSLGFDFFRTHARPFFEQI